jgi:hypothetical protein
MKKPVGRPSSGGKRVQIRFKSDNQVETIRKAVEKLNSGTDYSEVTFNGFVSGVAFKEAQRILKVSMEKSGI